MHKVRPFISLACTVMLLAPTAGFAADSHPLTAGAQSHGFLGRITSPYRPGDVPEPQLGNTTRLESLMRAGNIYLSLQDAIALALENNLDIAIQRYGPQIADVALMQAEAGSFARGVSTSVTAGPSSASVSSSGTTLGSNQSASSQASAASSTAVGSSVLSSSGPSIPSLDPAFVSTGNWAHTTTPESSSFTTGTTNLIQHQTVTNMALQKGFLTGSTVSLALNNTATSSNNYRNDFSPSTSSTLGISFTQHLLQGFGWGVNSRQIHIARNNREVADLTFKLQVITTVASVMELYWDLVSFNRNVHVAQEAVASAQRLYQDNKRQVEVGTMAQLEVVRAEAQIASAQQSLVVAQMQVLQQETILKTALSRNGLASPSVADAHVIPTDQIHIPEVEAITPIQDMTALAISSRPELVQSRIQLQNQQLTIKGSKNSLMPTLDAVASVSNSGLAGDINTLAPPAGSVRSNNQYFIGGYGTVLNQVFSRDFPNYAVGFSLNIPIRNRAAQAQVINDELTMRQQQLALQRLQNQVRVDVQNAMIGLTTARAQYQTATKARLLQAQTLDAEQKKLELGASTVYNVIADQQAVAAAEYSEVQAEAAYAKAKVELDRATGQILNHNSISLDEAYKGVVARPPSALPPAGTE